MMKRIVAGSLTLILLVVLTGCGSKLQPTRDAAKEVVKALFKKSERKPSNLELSREMSQKIIAFR
jgi:outer membrane lipopolysaccharide assembly protein LptE/RlpB